LLLQLWVPLLQLPQLCDAPFKQATHCPVLARHSGMLPEQLGWFTHDPSLEHERGVAPTQSRVVGWHTAHLLPTQNPLLHSEVWVQASPTLQLPQLIPGPEHEFRLSNTPASLHWWAIPLLHSATPGTQSTQFPLAGRQ
jgi:hypothetical protein